MTLRQRVFGELAVLATRRPGRVLAVCGVLTLVMLAAMSRLSMKTQFVDMMPKDLPQIQEFLDIIDEYQSASTLMLVVESPDKDVARMKEVADELVAKLASVKRVRPPDNVQLPALQQIRMWFGKLPEGVPLDTIELVKRIDYKLDNEFVSRHGMMLQKPADLESFQGMFGSLSLPSLVRSINDNFEKEYIEDSDNLATLDGEAEAVQGLESMYKFVASLGSYVDARDTAAVEQAVREFVAGPEYFISPDNSLLMIMIQPTVDMEQFEDGMYLGYQVFDTLKAMNARYDDVELGGTGWMLIQIDETEATKKDFGWPSLIALLLILLLLISSYRSWRNPFFATMTLVVALIWTTGFLALALQYLNMMSAAFGLILIGLGIDFGIHMISGYRDGGEHGLAPAEAIAYSFDRVAAGIVTGALTTAIVFFSLVLAGFEAFSEMGIAIGSGICITMVAALTLLPALIAWDTKGHSVTGTALRRVRLGFVVSAWNALGRAIGALFGLAPFRWLSACFQFGWLGSAGAQMRKLPVALGVLVFAAVTVALSYWGFTRMQWQYNMMELEPVGIPSGIAQDKIIDHFEIAPDYAMLKASGLEQCRQKVEQLKKAGDRTGVIGGVESITDFVPDMESQRRNRPVIAAFEARLRAMPVPASLRRADLDTLQAQLVRLHQNFVEIGELSVAGSGEGNKIVRKCDQIVGARDEDSKVLALARLVDSLKDDPGLFAPYQRCAARVLKERLLHMCSTDSITLESLPATIRERYVSPVSGDLLVTIYAKSNIWEERILRRFSEVTTAVSERTTGTVLIMLLFMDLMKEKGRLAVMIGAVAILLFLYLDFRSVRYTLLAMVPLAVGTLWMLGMMAAMGMKFNFVNVMCLPLILGIGIDDGVHVLHRYRREGRGSIAEVMKYTGRAIILTSLTTMIGFGSMALATHRGMASMGQVLFLGVGACFLSSAFVLPAIITLLERRR